MWKQAGKSVQPMPSQGLGPARLRLKLQEMPQNQQEIKAFEQMFNKGRKENSSPDSYIEACVGKRMSIARTGKGTIHLCGEDADFSTTQAIENPDGRQAAFPPSSGSNHHHLRIISPHARRERGGID
jgi:hypothetical protein